MITQFNFGFGLVDAHQHSNGGGWIQNTASVEASVFVGPDAQVYGSARAYGSAQVCGLAQVYGSARVYDSARVYGSAVVCGSGVVSQNPLHILGFEFPITACDNQVQIGCKTLQPESLRLNLFPEEKCPNLRQVGPELIVAILAHFKRCTQ